MNGRSLITAKNVGMVAILCAASATIIILNQPNSKRKGKKRKMKVALGHEELATLHQELETQRQKICNEFERLKHKEIPEEMNKVMDFLLHDQDPATYPPNIRLLASQLIQDYAIMHTNVHKSEPDPQIIAFAKQWLDFDCRSDAALSVEQINHRYALALRSRSMKEFGALFQWLQAMDATLRERDSIRQNWILRNFQCACLLGQWRDVKAFGLELEKVEPEMLAANGQPQAPLHPLHLFEYIALKLPNQSANFTQVYYNVGQYTKRFDPLLAPPTKFTEWAIRDCTTMITFGFSTDSERNEKLVDQVERAKESGKKPTPVPSTSRFMFVYGCLVQFPCYWVQLPASNTKMQPVVLTGPWNDSEMELTASYIRRISQHPESAHEVKGDRIRVVRSDLRLRLDRKDPFSEHDDDDSKEALSPKSRKKNAGWNWEGTFEHEEGILECYEQDLNNFEFRRNRKWKSDAVSYTGRAWKCNMVIGTPD